MRNVRRILQWVRAMHHSNLSCRSLSVVGNKSEVSRMIGAIPDILCHRQTDHGRFPISAYNGTWVSPQPYPITILEPCFSAVLFRFIKRISLLFHFTFGTHSI